MSINDEQTRRAYEETLRRLAEGEPSVTATRTIQQASAFDRLVTALAENFTDTQLHALMVAAEHPDNRGASHWELLRRAAINAAGCTDCAATRR